MLGVEKFGRNLSKELNNKYRRAGHKIDSIFKRSATKDRYHVEDEIWRAGQKYVPQVYPGKITLFRADQVLGIYPDPLLGWAGLGAGGLEIHEVSGSDHESIVVEPHVRSLAKELKQCIENAVLEAEQILVKRNFTWWIKLEFTYRYILRCLHFLSNKKWAIKKVA
jgi:hypothetical protein